MIKTLITIYRKTIFRVRESELESQYFPEYRPFWGVYQKFSEGRVPGQAHFRVKP